MTTIEPHNAVIEKIFAPSREGFDRLIGDLQSEGALALTHSELENQLWSEGMALLRQLFQDHLDLRSVREVRHASLCGQDGVSRTHRRPSSRNLETVFGSVTVSRLEYRAPGHDSLHPLDAALNLSDNLFSHGVSRRIAESAAQGAYETAIETLAATSGASVAKRQAETLAIKAAVDFDAFYAQRAAPPTGRESILVLTVDGKGIVMRQEDLREGTRKSAQKGSRKLKHRLAKGEKPNRKRMSTVIEMPDGKYIAFVKGASEYIISSCDYFHNMENNQIIPITFEMRKQFEGAIEGFANKALRTIGLAYKIIDPSRGPVDNPDDHGIHEYEKGGLNLIGICGIKDVIRPEVPASIVKCHRAGIDVKMVTGDNKTTATAIAREVGIITAANEKRAIVLEGPEFLRRIGGIVCENCRDKDVCDCVKNENELKTPGNEDKKVVRHGIKNKEAFNAIWKDLCVLARSRPEDKYALVTGLKELDNVVAVTGDGTNDAPALSKANVGFAMNIAGTEVAKHAADILLMDDNFASIIVAVKWGRSIYASIQKFLQIQLTVNLVAVIITVISAVGLKEAVLSPVQMLWINLVMDTLAALALATEPPSDELLERRPINKNDYIITLTMIKHIVGQAIYQLIVLNVFVFVGHRFLFDINNRQTQPNSILIYNGFEELGWNQNLADQFQSEHTVHAAYNFNVFMVMTWFNFFNCRVLDDRANIFHRIHKSVFLIIILISILGLQIIFLTFCGPAIRVVQWGLGPASWALCFGFGFIVWIVRFLLIFIPTEKSHLGLGNREITRAELNKASLVSIKRSHNSEFYTQHSVRRQSVIQAGGGGSLRRPSQMGARLVAESAQNPNVQIDNKGV